MTRRRFDYATELRAFAKRLRDLRYRDPETSLINLDDLARDMDNRADEVVSTIDPAPDGPFLTGRGRSASGRSFTAETRPTRRLAAA